MPSASDDGVDDGIRRLLSVSESGAVTSISMSLEPKPPPAAATVIVAGVLEVGDRGLHLFAERDLVGVGVGRDGVGDAAAAAGEGVAQRRAARADRDLHGLDALDLEQDLLDLLGCGVLGLQARGGADVLGHRERVLARVAEEVRLHERRDRDRADEHEHGEPAA